MANYLVAKVNTATKSYTLKDAEPSTKPYLKVSNSYLPLQSTSSTTNTGLYVKVDTKNYVPVESYTTTRSSAGIKINTYTSYWSGQYSSKTTSVNRQILLKIVSNGRSVTFSSPIIKSYTLLYSYPTYQINITNYSCTTVMKMAVTASTMTFRCDNWYQTFKPTNFSNVGIYKSTQASDSYYTTVWYYSYNYYGSDYICSKPYTYTQSSTCTTTVSTTSQ